MNAIAPDLQSWLATQRRDVEAALDGWIPEHGCEPEFVWQAMRYSLLAGGKRLRPVLTLGTAEAVAHRDGANLEEARRLALPAACALELIHTYSLVHDDLPAMDNDVLRRGRPTAHVVYGEGLAILAGDGLLTEAFALLAREPRDTAAHIAPRKISAISIIASAAGACGMVGGQAIDLRAATPGGAVPTVETLRDMHARKTGALIRAAVISGAVMAGAEPDTTSTLSSFGDEIGLAFQIVDDILDVEGASADLGKTAGKDAAAGKPTYVALYGLEGARRLADECLERALESLRRAHVAGQLPAIARWVVGRSS